MKPNEIELKKGMVVQLSPDTKNPVFAGCFMVVSDPKPFGAQGYIEPLGSDKVTTFKGIAYYRATWEEMEYVGEAVREIE